MKLSAMIEEVKPGILWWKLANLTERVLPWRWSQALRHGPHNVGRWLRGYPVSPWIAKR